MQDAVDYGHQPWRTSAVDVAAACAEAVLLPGPEQPTVRRTNPHTVAVRTPSGKLVAIVQLAQPVKQGPEGLWVITRVDRIAERQPEVTMRRVKRPPPGRA